MPYRSLTSQKLLQAIHYCLSPEAAAAAQRLSESIQAENGVLAAVESFHSHLPQAKMVCDFYPEQPAALLYDAGKKSVKMCKPVASILVKSLKVDRRQLKL